VPYDEIHSAVPGEVAGDDPIPPPVALLEPGDIELYQLSVTRVVENRDRHPLAYHDQVRSPVAVNILPYRIRHHSHVRQSRRGLVRYICELSVAIVVQKNAPRIDTVAARHAATANEQIHSAVAIEVCRFDARTAEGEGRQ